MLEDIRPIVIHDLPGNEEMDFHRQNPAKEEWHM
jgi:hypothetical protein